jgi:hypothetical protein
MTENKYINKTKLSIDKRCVVFSQSSIRQTLKDLNIFNFQDMNSIQFFRKIISNQIS